MEFAKVVANPEILRAIVELGYTEMTSIQERAIPPIQEGKDVVSQSHTGSGKTMAFGIPIFEKLTRGGGLKAIALVPTRELCQQVYGEMQKLSKHKSLSVVQVYGGVGIEPQISAVRTADMVVGTPGRVLDLISRRALRLDQIQIFVLDEADKMFEMGFVDDVQKIMSFAPTKKQTLLFSATFTSDIQKIIKRFMRDPVTIKTEEFVDKSLLEETYYQVQHHDRFSLLVHLLKAEGSKLVLVFTGSRRTADLLAYNLKLQGFESQALHGGLSQNKRSATLQAFHDSKLHVLVATDVAARGLDIKNVSHVYNFDIPKTDKEYLHRIGRTARAGKEGKAISLLSEKDHDNFRRVLQNRSIKVTRAQNPEFKQLQFSTRMQRNPDDYVGHYRGAANRPGQRRGSGNFRRGSRNRR